MRMRDLGVFERTQTKCEERQVPLAGLAPGVQQTDDIIFELSESEEVLWAVDRSCDHAGGKLVVSADGREAVCPLHGWALDTGTLCYKNAQVSKHRLDFTVRDGVLHYQRDVHALTPPRMASVPAAERVTVRLLSHACVCIDIGETRIVTDPWLLGPCFVTGWWHLRPPLADALDVMNSADLVYISHNHPDHLHPETLADLRRDMPILVPAFPSGSTERPMRELGFKNVNVAPFNHVFELEDVATPVRLSVLQAGDFRDDSGLWVEGGEFSALLSVDSNKLNNYVLPQGLDLMMTAFAGGATGFPVCFDVVPDDTKSRVVARNRGAVRAQVTAYLEASRPKVFVPYAGYFTESAPEDGEIKMLNKKNSSGEIVDLVAQNFDGVSAFDPMETDKIIFDKGRVSAVREEGALLYENTPDYVQGYLTAIDAECADWDEDTVVSYFAGARFRDSLVVYIEPCARDFSTMTGEVGFAIDFSGDVPHVWKLSTEGMADVFSSEELAPSMRKLFVRVRKASLWRVISTAMPWEDLSIGFQCRINRTPDVYNSDFWFYFTNVYIGEAVRKDQAAA